MIRVGICAFCGQLASERNLDINGECRALDGCARFADRRGLIPFDEAEALQNAWVAYYERMLVVRGRAAR